jgi:hypothetical protein
MLNATVVEAREPGPPDLLKFSAGDGHCGFRTGVNMDTLPNDLKSGSPVAQRLVGSLGRAYTAHLANHDPLIGCDSFTLGVGLWRGSWHYIEDEFPDLARRPKGTFYLDFPEYNLYIYRDRPHGNGHRVMGDSHVQRALLRVNSQICFDFLQSNINDGKPNLVLLHAGLVELTEVGIGLPVTPTDPDTSWFFFERLFVLERPTPPSTSSGRKEHHKRFDELEVPDIDIFPEEDLGEDATTDGDSR